MSGDLITSAQVAVLLDPMDRVAERVDMPVILGEWVALPVYKRGPSRWVFELSAMGEVVADRAAELVAASTASLADYLTGERASCFTGAFRDGFARGADWQRRKEAAP